MELKLPGATIVSKGPGAFPGMVGLLGTLVLCSFSGGEAGASEVDFSAVFCLPEADSSCIALRGDDVVFTDWLSFASKADFNALGAVACFSLRSFVLWVKRDLSGTSCAGCFSLTSVADCSANND